MTQAQVSTSNNPAAENAVETAKQPKSMAELRSEIMSTGEKAWERMADRIGEAITFGKKLAYFAIGAVLSPKSTLDLAKESTSAFFKSVAEYVSNKYSDWRISQTAKFVNESLKSGSEAILKNSLSTKQEQEALGKVAGIVRQAVEKLEQASELSPSERRAVAKSVKAEIKDGMEAIVSELAQSTALRFKHASDFLGDHIAGTIGSLNRTANLSKEAKSELQATYLLDIRVRAEKLGFTVANREDGSLSFTAPNDLSAREQVGSFVKLANELRAEKRELKQEVIAQIDLANAAAVAEQASKRLDEIRQARAARLAA